MNEQKRMFLNFKNPKQTKQQELVDFLISQGNDLLKHRNSIKWEYIVYIENALHKQLNQRNAKIPSSILNSIAKKFQKIQSQIQR